MSHLSLPLKFLLSIILGGIVGLERESVHQKKHDPEAFRMGKLGGVRTFALMSLLGATAGYLSVTNNPALFLIITITFFVLICTYYAVKTILVKSAGLTTGLSALYTFIIGFFLTNGGLSTEYVIALTVILVLILSVKEQAKELVLGTKRAEIEAFLGFAIVALVILPFLPNKAFYITDIPAVKTVLQAYEIQLGVLEKLEIINPFKLWFIVALVTGIDIFGYILGKAAGKKKGVLLTSAIGGFISSTSATQSLAQQSKRSTLTNQLVAAAIIANLTSFLPIFAFVAPINSKWLVAITPTLFIIMLSALIVSIFFLTTKKSTEDEDNPDKSTHQVKDRIFALAPAVKFAFLLISIRLVTKVSLAFFGQAGFLASSIIASFSGLDAIVINLAELAGQAITFKAALLTLICVNATNLLGKSVYAFLQARRDFSIKLFLAMLTIIASSLLGYLFF